MRKPCPRPPDAVRRILRHLLPGARGAEILEELDREHEVLHERRTAGFARAWYLAQLLRPATWQLARALRRSRRVEEDAHIERGTGVERIADVRGGGRAPPPPPDPPPASARRSLPGSRHNPVGASGALREE